MLESTSGFRPEGASEEGAYMTQSRNGFTEKRGGWCYNIKQLFNYRPATQNQMREFLFSDSERLSTFLSKEERLEMQQKRKTTYRRKESKKNNGSERHNQGIVRPEIVEGLLEEDRVQERDV